MLGSRCIGCKRPVKRLRTSVGFGERVMAWMASMLNADSMMTKKHCAVQRLAIWR
ncbi:hypothetical protein Y023_5442 [Burkholderia pseudomallei A79D]|nr:hypothetical protein Y023_5442 [Burkholderia pseudomallei A79D]KGX96126.1 hypothetical protein X997_5227 [Burkholderia pseudomallei A79C]